MLMTDAQEGMVYFNILVDTTGDIVLLKVGCYHFLQSWPVG